MRQQLITSTSDNLIVISAPAAFTGGMWALTAIGSTGINKLQLYVSSWPAAGSSPTTFLDYRINGGAPIAVPYAATISTQITVPANALASVQVRARSLTATGPWSTAKTATPLPSEISLVGALPVYTAAPLLGQDVDTNYVPADVADFSTTTGTIASVVNYILVQTALTEFEDVEYGNATIEAVLPGDRLTPYCVVTDSNGNTRTFNGTQVTVALPAPAVQAQPTLPATLEVGLTSFSVDFGFAGPSGESGFLGDYSPTRTLVFTINGANRVGNLTLIAGNQYLYSGAALTDNATVIAQSLYNNATAPTTPVASAAVSRTVAAVFSVSRDDVTFEAIVRNPEGTVTGTLSSPEPYASFAGPAGPGTFSVDSTLHATGPVAMFPPVIEQVGAVYSLVQEDVWTSAVGATGFTRTGQWLKNGTALVPPETGTVYGGPLPATGENLTYRGSALDSNSGGVPRTSTSNVISSLTEAVIAPIGTMPNSIAGSTLTPSFTLDLTGYDAGDRIVVVYGAASYATGCTVAGVAATQKHTYTGATAVSIGRISVYEAVLAAPGAPGAAIALTLTGSANNHHIYVLGVKDGQVDTVVSTHVATTPQNIEQTISPASTQNEVWGFAFGNNSTAAFTDGTGITWTGLTKLSAGVTTPAGLGRSHASGTDLPVASVVGMSRVIFDRAVGVALVSIVGV